MLCRWKLLNGKATAPLGPTAQSSTHDLMPDILDQREFWEACVSRQWPPGRAYATASLYDANVLPHDGVRIPANPGSPSSVGVGGYLFGGAIGLEVSTWDGNDPVDPHRFRENPYKLSASSTRAVPSASESIGVALTPPGLLYRRPVAFPAERFLVIPRRGLV